MPTLTCLIPAYNERDRIGNVLKVATEHPLIDEVIVIDDGSRDGTGEMVKTYSRAQLLTQKNQGKSAAICHGVQKAKGDFLLFLDADLVGLTIEHLTKLIEPVLGGQADISISLRENAPRAWRMIGLDFISGERVFSRALIESHIPEILSLPGFGLESFMNLLIIKGKLRIKVVPWKGVGSPYKYKKYQGGRWDGIKGDIGMFRDIFKVISPLTVLWQIWRMCRMRV